MAIDTTPSTVATNALQAIPFEALIGGPLDACIKAQAVAAKTSWEFINEVGLTIDPDTGEKKAINVTFEYNNNGKLTTLVVPLIILLPIPYLAINAVTIDFMANISAASSSVQETSSDTSLGVDATAEASLGIGPFSLKISASANYSSKQASKASQNSSYSVEYTMNVHVEGGQADMPAGLATVLNILQGSVTSVSIDDSIAITPANVSLNKVQSTTLQVVVKDTHGILAPGVKVSLAVEDNSPFESIAITKGNELSALLDGIDKGTVHPRILKPFLRHYPVSTNYKIAASRTNRFIPASTTQTAINAAKGGNNVIDAVTDQNGSVTFKLTLKDDVYFKTDLLQGKIKIGADVPVAGTSPSQTKTETQTVVYSIIPLGPVYDFTFSNSLDKSLSFTKAAEEQALNIGILDGNQNTVKNFPKDIKATVKLDNNNNADTIFDKITVDPGKEAGTPTAETATGKFENDQLAFKFKTKAGLTSQSITGVIVFSADFVQEHQVPFTVDIP